MTNLALTKEEAKEEAGVSPDSYLPKYPYGLTLYLDQAQIIELVAGGHGTSAFDAQDGGFSYSGVGDEAKTAGDTAGPNPDASDADDDMSF